MKKRTDPSLVALYAMVIASEILSVFVFAVEHNYRSVVATIILGIALLVVIHKCVSKECEEDYREEKDEEE